MRGAGPSDGVVAAVAARAEGNPLFAEEMVRRLSEEEGARAAELPATVQALLAARLDSLEPFQRRLLAHAAVIGRTFWEGGLTSVAEAEGGDLAEALRALRDKDIIVAGEGTALAGEPELAFKHALIRDAAYEMLPKAVRAQKHFEVACFIEDGAGERGEEVVALLAEHYGKAAELGGELGLAAAEMAPYRAKALSYLEAAGDAATAFYSNADAFSNYEAALEQAGEDADAVARLLEKQGDVALRLGRVDAAIEVWGRALDHHGAREDLEHVAELHRKIGAGLAHKGERKRAIEHHQRGINLIKDGEPSLALVRLYEEAAWLYMQTGDNMLAIYASEKALRLAERSYRRAHELAEQIGWSEVCFDALYGLSNTLRDQGELVGAETALSQALDVCERAGLIAQSIQANSAQALLHTLAGRHEKASEAAQEAIELSDRVRYPAGEAAAIEAAGIVGPLPGALRELERAHEAWQNLGRPLEAARCDLLLGQRLLEDDREAALVSLERAANEYDELGVIHLAARARELAGSDAARR